MNLTMKFHSWPSKKNLTLSMDVALIPLRNVHVMVFPISDLQLNVYIYIINSSYNFGTYSNHADADLKEET